MKSSHAYISFSFEKPLNSKICHNRKKDNFHYTLTLNDCTYGNISHFVFERDRKHCLFTKLIVNIFKYLLYLLNNIVTTETIVLCFFLEQKWKNMSWLFVLPAFWRYEIQHGHFVLPLQSCQPLPRKKVQSIWQFLKALRHEALKTKGDQKPL